MGISTSKTFYCNLFFCKNHHDKEIDCHVAALLAMTVFLTASKPPNIGGFFVLRGEYARFTLEMNSGTMMQNKCNTEMWVKQWNMI